MTGVTPEMARSWANALADKTEIEIRVGLWKVQSFTGYFSLPTFKELCQFSAEDAGLSSADDAWKEVAANIHNIRAHKWSHPVVYKAMVTTEIFHIRNTTDPRATRKLFDRNYDIACRMFLAGEDLGVDIPKALEHQKAKPLHWEENKARLAQLREAIGL